MGTVRLGHAVGICLIQLVATRAATAVPTGVAAATYSPPNAVASLSPTVGCGEAHLFMAQGSARDVEGLVFQMREQVQRSPEYLAQQSACNAITSFGGEPVTAELRELAHWGSGGSVPETDEHELDENLIGGQLTFETVCSCRFVPSACAATEYVEISAEGEIDPTDVLYPFSAVRSTFTANADQTIERLKSSCATNSGTPVVLPVGAENLIVNESRVTLEFLGQPVLCKYPCAAPPTVVPTEMFPLPPAAEPSLLPFPFEPTVSPSPLASEPFAGPEATAAALPAASTYEPLPAPTSSATPAPSASPDELPLPTVAETPWLWWFVYEVPTPAPASPSPTGGAFDLPKLEADRSPVPEYSPEPTGNTSY